MADDKDSLTAGHGYCLGPRAFGIEVVRRARKEFECEGPLVDSDFANIENVSPATGAVVSEGRSADCSRRIRIGDLYVAADHSGEYVVELKGPYRYTWRTCLACASGSDIIEPCS